MSSEEQEGGPAAPDNALQSPPSSPAPPKTSTAKPLFHLGDTPISFTLALGVGVGLLVLVLLLVCILMYMCRNRKIVPPTGPATKSEKRRREQRRAEQMKDFTSGYEKENWRHGGFAEPEDEREEFQRFVNEQRDAAVKEMINDEAEKVRKAKREERDHPLTEDEEFMQELIDDEAEKARDAWSEQAASADDPAHNYDPGSDTSEETHQSERRKRTEKRRRHRKRRD